MEEPSFSFQQPEFPTPEKKSKSPLIFVLIFILILFAGFTGILASRIWDPLWNPFRPNPEAVIAKAVKEMEKLKTFQQKFNGEIGISILEDGRSPSKAKINFKFSGSSKQDITQPEKPKADSSFDLEISVTGEENIGAKFAIGGKLVRIGEEAYLKLTKLPDLGPFLPVSFDFSQIKDSWIKIDQESIINLQKKLGEEYGLEVEEFSKERMEKEKKIQEELQEKIKEKLMGRKWFVVKKELPDERIDGIKVYHYVVSLNNAEIINLIPEIWKEVEKVMLEETGMAPTTGEEEMKRGLKEFFEKIGELEGEIWIGKKDYLLYKFKGAKRIDLKKFDEYAKGEMAFSLELENSNFNQPVKIEAPSEYKTLDEVMLFFLGSVSSFLESPKTKTTNDEALIANALSIQLLAALIYDTDNSYKNLCQNSVLNKKHPEFGSDLARVEKEIKDAQGGTLSLSCYSSAQSYCIIVDLVSPGRGRYCIDSSGQHLEVSKNLSCIGKGTSNDPYRCPKEKTQLKFPLERNLLPASILEGFSRLFKR